MLKVIKCVDSVIDKIVSIILIFALLIGIYLIYDNIYIFNNATGKKVQGYKPNTVEQAEEVLKELSDECVAWLTINDTKIDYPIMQGSDNLVYLNKDPYGDYNLAGSIFLDASNSADFSDSYSLLYGHHLANRYMFGELDSWTDRLFFENHLDGELVTSNGISYHFKIFAVANVSAYTKSIFNPVGNYPMQEIKQNAIYWNEPVDGRLLILSTCKSTTSPERLIVCGMLY